MDWNQFQEKEAEFAGGTAQLHGVNEEGEQSFEFNFHIARIDDDADTLEIIVPRETEFPTWISCGQDELEPAWVLALSVDNPPNEKAFPYPFGDKKILIPLPPDRYVILTSPE